MVRRSVAVVSLGELPRRIGAGEAGGWALFLLFWWVAFLLLRRTAVALVLLGPYGGRAPRRV
ncbi:hypothetical protein A247_22198 [Pseudomonas syringae pv. actinidiae ICMP 19099]|nr:hypothetical protein A247_22198 [Pseudomonas syringae pv. actinidiae ICMP 19099]